MSRTPDREPVTTGQIQALADATPADLVALELQRRRIKARTKPDGCRYRLYLAEKAIRDHEWMAARRQDWRTARKALRYAADRVEQLRSRHAPAGHTDGPGF